MSEQPGHSMAPGPVKLLTNLISQSAKLLVAPVCLSQTACGVIYPGEERLCCDWTLSDCVRGDTKFKSKFAGAMIHDESSTLCTFCSCRGKLGS